MDATNSAAIKNLSDAILELSRKGVADWAAIAISILALLISLHSAYKLYYSRFNLFAALGQRLIFGRKIVDKNIDILAIGAVVNISNTGAIGGVVYNLGLKISKRNSDQRWIFQANDLIKNHGLSPVHDEDFEGRFNALYIAGRETKQLHISFQQPGDQQKFPGKTGEYRGRLLICTNGKTWKEADRFNFVILEEQSSTFSTHGAMSILTDLQLNLDKLLYEV